MFKRRMPVATTCHKTQCESSFTFLGDIKLGGDGVPKGVENSQDLNIGP